MHILASPCIAQPLPRPGQAMPCTRWRKQKAGQVVDNGIKTTDTCTREDGNSGCRAPAPKSCS